MPSPNTSPVLDISHITRSYTLGSGSHNEKRTVLHDVSLSISRGEILCLVGPNGAGKTTTVKIAGTLLLPDSGDVHICGVDAVAQPRKARSHVALLLGGENGFYRNVSARDNLRYFADLAHVPYRQREQRIDEALERVGLLDKAQDRVQTFSRGMWQRLHIARALVSRPDLLLLDEPTNGLDPENARNVRSLIQDLRASGTAILLTTHEMAEAEKLSDSVAIINNGTIIARGKVNELASRAHIDHISVYTYSGTALLNDDIITNVTNTIFGMDSVQWCEISQSHGAWTITVAWSIPQEQSDAISLPLDDVHLLGNRPASLEETYLAIVHRARKRSNKTDSVSIADATPMSEGE